MGGLEKLSEQQPHTIFISAIQALEHSIAGKHTQLLLFFCLFACLFFVVVVVVCLLSSVVCFFFSLNDRKKDVLPLRRDNATWRQIYSIVS